MLRRESRCRCRCRCRCCCHLRPASVLEIEPLEPLRRVVLCYVRGYPPRVVCEYNLRPFQPRSETYLHIPTYTHPSPKARTPPCTRHQESSPIQPTTAATLSRTRMQPLLPPLPSLALFPSRRSPTDFPAYRPNRTSHLRARKRYQGAKHAPKLFPLT